MFEMPVRYVAQPPLGHLDDTTLLAAARERAAHLADASKQLAGSLNLARTIRRALHVTVPAIADWAQLMVPARGGVQYVASRTDRPDRLVAAIAERPRVGEFSGQGRLLVTGRPEILHVDADQQVLPDGVSAMVPAPELRESVLALRPADLLALPLTARGTTFGTLTLARRAGRGFEPEDVELGVELAARIAVAIDTARLYEEQARIAEVLAASLRVPELPETPGLTVAARTRAALHTADIGGDFLDVFGQPGDWSVLLGDVTGKGAEAAILTGQARHTVRGAAYFDRRPGELLRVLNAAIHSVPGSPSFLTALCARARPREDGSVDVVLASAGHPAPLLVRAGGEVREVRVRGLLCGAVPSVTYTETIERLEPGDMLLFFTDGVPEAVGADERYGLARLERLAARYAGAGPHALVEAVDIAVAEFNSGQASDDVAVLAFGSSARPR